MLVVNVTQLQGRVEDIELSPSAIIPTLGDVRTAILVIPPNYTKDEFLARVVDILKRSDVSDADRLISELELRCSRAEDLIIGFNPIEERITLLQAKPLE